MSTTVCLLGEPNYSHTWNNINICIYTLCIKMCPLCNLRSRMVVVKPLNRTLFAKNSQLCIVPKSESS